MQDIKHCHKNNNENNHRKKYAREIIQRLMAEYDAILNTLHMATENHVTPLFLVRIFRIHPHLWCSQDKQASIGNLWHMWKTYKTWQQTIRGKEHLNRTKRWKIKVEITSKRVTYFGGEIFSIMFLNWPSDIEVFIFSVSWSVVFVFSMCHK